MEGDTMKKTLVGLVASVALMGSGVALAEEHQGAQKPQPGAQQQQMGDEVYGGSGAQGQQQPGQAAMKGEKELTGIVVKSSARELHLRTEHGIIPLRVQRETEFPDPNVRRLRDIRDGQQVRARFVIEQENNVARSISLMEGVGGTGMEHEMEHGMEHGMEHEPMQGE
jgi:opacity protein-like surface antigen